MTETHPISRAVMAEVFAALKGRRASRDLEEILGDFSTDEVAAWRSEQEAQERAEDEKSTRTRRLTMAGVLAEAAIPTRFKTARFESLDSTREPSAFQACQSYVQNNCELHGKTGLILRGPAGNGKTALACACLHAYLDLHQGKRTARFWNASHGLQRLRDQVNRSHDDEEHLLDLAGYGLLVIDDLGKQKLTEWVADQFYTLVDTLYREEIPVILTTNCDPPQLSQWLDRAVVSRIFGMCADVHLSEFDYRTHEL